MLMKKRGGFPRSLSLFLVGILEGDGLGARSRRESTTANRQCHGMIWSLLFTKDVATMDDGRQKGAPQEQSEQPPPQPRRGLFSWPFVVSPTNSLSAWEYHHHQVAWLLFGLGGFVGWCGGGRSGRDLTDKGFFGSTKGGVIGHYVTGFGERWRRRWLLKTLARWCQYTGVQWLPQSNRLTAC